MMNSNNKGNKSNNRQLLTAFLKRNGYTGSGCDAETSNPEVCKSSIVVDLVAADETTVGTEETQLLSDNGSYVTSPSDTESVSTSTTRTSITHPPTSSRQARLRKLSGKRISLRQAMLERYNQRQAALEEMDDYDVIQKLRDYDCGSTLATLETSSMDFTLDPAESGSADDDDNRSNKNEMQQMEEVMMMLQDKLGFSPVAVVGSQHPRLSSVSALPFEENDEATDDGDELQKEMKEMESIMSAMKKGCGFKPVPISGRVTSC